VPGVYLANRYRAGCTLSLPVGLVRGENNRRGYVRRSCSVGLMDGGSIPPGSTTSPASGLDDAAFPVSHRPAFAPSLGRSGCDVMDHALRDRRALQLVILAGVVKRLEKGCVPGAQTRRLGLVGGGE
jgi:hypothetical protein